MGPHSPGTRSGKTARPAISRRPADAFHRGTPASHDRTDLFQPFGPLHPSKSHSWNDLPSSHAVGTVLALAHRREAAMATPYPSSGDRDRRPRTGERMIRTTLNVVGVGAFLAAPAAAVSLWLLLTDPLLAGEVADRNSLFPVVKTLFFGVVKASSVVLSYL